MTAVRSDSAGVLSSRRRVVVITGDPIGEKMAGPAIRAWNISADLARDHSVRLISLSTATKESQDFTLFTISPFDDLAFGVHEKWAEVIIFQGHAMEFFPSLQRSQKILVADVYDPMHLEQLEQAREFSLDVWQDRVSHATRVLNQQLGRADFFLCASERQRLFWLGQLAGLGRLNPASYADDPDFSRLIAVVPFGLEGVFPDADRSVLKGVIPGIAIEDKVLLWSGGLYNWFDPQTLIRAVSTLVKRRPTVRLFFQGTKHPHPGVPEMEIVAKSRALAANLGVLDSAVFFNQSWVDYGDRHNYLSEADAGVSTHFDHIETTMSFRTRILDYLWAGLPMVVTDGDFFAELIREEDLGIVVEAEDEHSLAEALEVVLFDPQVSERMRHNIDGYRGQFRWEVVLKPLHDFVDHARLAGDSAYTLAGARNAPLTGPDGPVGREVARIPLIMTAIRLLRTGGLGAFAGAVARRLGRR